MNRFTVEETNLLSIYHEGSKAQLIENMTAALPYMDAGLRELAERMILSRLVDTFFSRISPTMQLPPKHHSIAYVLPWAEGLHWQSRSSGCSNS